MTKIYEITNSILDRASDFKYFVLLGTFLLFLDSVLILNRDSELTELTFVALKEDFSIGSVLLFLCLFCLFASFFSRTIQLIVTVLLTLIPYKIYALFSFDKGNSALHSQDYVYSSSLLAFAIRTNNEVAYKKYLRWETQKDDRQLPNYCFSFLLASIYNIYACFTKDIGILSFLFELDSEAGAFSVDPYILLVTLFLYGAIIFLGVFVGCGIVTNRDEGRILILNHQLELKNKNDVSPG